jgi:hypothetical protein
MFIFILFLISYTTLDFARYCVINLECDMYILLVIVEAILMGNVFLTWEDFITSQGVSWK